MTSDLQTQTFTIWLPLLITVVVGAVGLIRGAVREAILASMVAIGAFVNSQWSAQWGQGLNGLYNNWPQQGEQFFISLIVLWAIALIVGYGLGSLVPRQTLTAQSRLVGLLLGLFSGAALAGWSLRYYITNTDGTLQPGGMLDNPISRGFVIWATWFPLMIILLATLVVLVVPLRRAQGSVATPAGDTDWKPSSPARPALGTGAVASPRVNVGPAPYAPVYPPPPSTQAAQVPGEGRSAAFVPGSVPYAPGSGSSAAPQTASLNTYPQYDSTRTRAFTPQPESPTAHLPTREVGSSTASSAPAPAAQSSEAPSPWAPKTSSTAPYSTFGSSSGQDSSWLLNDVDSAGPADKKATEVERVVPAAASLDEGSEPLSATLNAEKSDDAGAGVCPNCGLPVLPGASFCTNCGTRLTSS